MAALGLASCSEGKFRVEGAITSADDSVLYFERMGLDGPAAIDSARLGAGGFSFSGARVDVASHLQSRGYEGLGSERERSRRVGVYCHCGGHGRTLHLTQIGRQAAIGAVAFSQLAFNELQDVPFCLPKRHFLTAETGHIATRNGTCRKTRRQRPPLGAYVQVPSYDLH